MTATRAIPQAHELAFIYNDEFDRTHYPIQDWQRKAIAQVCEALQLPDARGWFYHATIHGAIFWCNAGDPHNGRMGAENMRAMLQVPGFRWIESDTSKITIGLTQKHPAGEQE